ncbi:unnamed protein product [Vicia faba]|uniref:Uncharacterized protein n=1 Tax=Vicia faba TaxID=3906 RepID=A0AAV0ZGS6_VICFA|nr:unnamed protein product [Vicia faba]
MNREGGYGNKPLILDGTNYDYYKACQDGKVTDVLKDGEDWNDEDEKSSEGNSKTLNALFNGVDNNIFRPIRNCNVAKEAWEILKTSHERSSKKDRIESFFLAHDADLWDMVIDGYMHPVDESGQKIDRKRMSDQQKRDFRNHHKARTILLSAISYSEPMVTALKLAKDLNKISLEELVSSLRIHEIEIEDDEPQKKEEDELSLLSRRVNQLWKQRQRKFRNSRRSGNQNESSSGYRKSEPSSGHRRSEASSGISNSVKFKNLKKDLASDSKETDSLRLENSELKEKISKLENDLQNSQKEIISEAPSSTDKIIKEYDHSFQKFLAKNIDRSKMASMIYGVSRNGRKGIGYQRKALPASVLQSELSMGRHMGVMCRYMLYFPALNIVFLVYTVRLASSAIRDSKVEDDWTLECPEICTRRCDDRRNGLKDAIWRGDRILMESVSGAYLNSIKRLNLNEYRDGIRIWSVSELYLEAVFE